ncbi:major facilitator superfamily domain-containing protein [Amylocarpus encephaloides]|uniref:Major facilitator superfamily domain-containing protein n=1 Tax=Amylocarpus encephaloides TaxID=45428 RepID=A0A9P7YC82_9HELO|nr:major facilitator superfamily domain-containing protein [Amylocarpus encephaloides]
MSLEENGEVKASVPIANGAQVDNDQEIQLKTHSRELAEKADGMESNNASVEEPQSMEYDLANPLNWSTWKKIVNMGIPSILCFVAAFGSSIYAPAIPDVMLDFHVSDTIATLSLTTYVLGLSFGPMLSAPISEMFGRLGTYRVAPPIGAIFTLAAGFSPNITTLCILRFFAGFFGGPSLSVCAGTSADLFLPKDRAVAGTFMLYFPFLGPVFGPVVGGYVTQHNGWEWSQYSLAIIIIATYLPVFFLGETYLKVQEAAAAAAPKPPASTLLLGVVFITLLRPVKMLLTEPIVGFLSLYVAFNFAVIFTFFNSVPYVFGSVYHFDRGNTGLVFLSVGLGCTLAVPTIIGLDRMFYQKEWALSVRDGKPGVVAPEHRLHGAILGALGLPVGLFCSCLYLIDTYAALTAASAVAANVLLRYVMGATFPLFTFAMYRKLGIGWATSILAFLSLVMLPIPWVLYKWGLQIRAASHFETNKTPL